MKDSLNNQDSNNNENTTRRGGVMKSKVKIDDDENDRQQVHHIHNYKSDKLCKEILINCFLIKGRVIQFWEIIVYKLKSKDCPIPINDILRLTKVFIYNTDN